VSGIAAIGPCTRACQTVPSHGQNLSYLVFNFVFSLVQVLFVSCNSLQVALHPIKRHDWAIFEFGKISMNILDAINPPVLAAEFAGVGGHIKQRPEDFEVEEIPAYEPAGSGEHLFLWIEKCGMGAEFFLRQVARRLEIPVGEVGMAGLKDRHAVTRQYVSVPATVEARLDRLDGDGIRLLRTARHGNKLRSGHLRGNRFRILVRDANSSESCSLEAILEKIRVHGLPNYYGLQRFGKDGETAELGLRLLKGDSNVRNAFLRKLALSATQSLLFNAYLSQRLTDGLLQNVLAGDVMAKWPAGGMFTAEDVAVEQVRFDRRETVHAGPMFGRKTFPTRHAAAEREASLLGEAGFTTSAFNGFGKLLPGTRRHNLVYIDDLATVWEPEGLRLSFTLPAGSYATVFLREIMKNDIVDDDAGSDAET
jgi:tRNA pseudouridine13 synthase